MDSELSLRIMFDLFKFIEDEEISNDEYKNAEISIINLNSVFSTTFYEEMMRELSDEDKLNDYVESVGEIFKMVLTHLSSHRIILVYTDQESEFTEIYEDWKKSRYENKEMNKFAKLVFKHFIEVFNKIKKVNPTIDIINTEEFYPTVFTHAFIRFRNIKEPIFLVSRDRLDFLNLINDNVILFDGQEFLTEENFDQHESKKLPNIDVHFLKYYYRLRGIKKYDYPGVRGKGEKRTLKYMSNHLDELVEGRNKFIDKQMRLFDFDMYIDNMTKEKYNKLVSIVNDTEF